MISEYTFLDMNQSNITGGDNNFPLDEITGLCIIACGRRVFSQGSEVNTFVWLYSFY